MENSQLGRFWASSVAHEDGTTEDQVTWQELSHVGETCWSSLLLMDGLVVWSHVGAVLQVTLGIRISTRKTAPCAPTLEQGKRVTVKEKQRQSSAE